MVDEELKKFSVENIIKSCVSDLENQKTPEETFVNKIHDSYYIGDFFRKRFLDLRTKLLQIDEEINEYEAQKHLKDCYIEACRVAGASYVGKSVVASALRKEFDFDQSLLRRGVNSLLIKRNKILSEISKFRLDFQKSPRVKKSQNAIINTPIIRVEDIQPREWISWPAPVENVPYDGDALSGLGPGENRIALIIGGAVQGNSTSFDVVTADGKKWEVKGVSSPGEDVRTGAKGIIAFHNARLTLIDLFAKIKILCDFYSIDAFADMIDSEILNDVRQFYNNENINFTVKCDLSQDRLLRLRTCLFAIGSLRPTDGDFSKLDYRLINSMTDYPAFVDPDAYLNQIGLSLRASRAFEGVDGLFITNKKLGFIYIPHEDYDACLIFARTFLGKPCYVLAKDLLPK